MKSRPDRLAHLQHQFEDKPEFKVTHITAIKHDIGAIGLWESICKAVAMAQKQMKTLSYYAKTIMNLRNIIVLIIYYQI